METITIPDALAARLRARAHANHSTLDAEALAVLEQGLGAQVPGVQARVPLDPTLVVREMQDRDGSQVPLADQIRAFRERLPVRMEPGEAERLVRAGRDRDDA